LDYDGIEANERMKQKDDIKEEQRVSVHGTMANASS
jgi:hypothetical protein